MGHKSKDFHRFHEAVATELKLDDEQLTENLGCLSQEQFQSLAKLASNSKFAITNIPFAKRSAYDIAFTRVVGLMYKTDEGFEQSSYRGALSLKAVAGRAACLKEGKEVDGLTKKLAIHMGLPETHKWAGTANLITKQDMSKIATFISQAPEFSRTSESNWKDLVYCPMWSED